MNKVLAFLVGKKTYIVGVIALIFGGLHESGVVNTQTYETALTILGPLGLMTLRDALNKFCEANKK